MEQSIILWCALVSVLMILVIWYNNRGESMISKEEKTNNIYNWFSTNSPDYEKYKSEVPHSSVVEYDATLSLLKNNKLTKDNVFDAI